MDSAIHSNTNQLITFKPPLLVAHVAVTCALGLLVALYSLSADPVRVEVDLSVSSGTRIALYVNDLTRQPFSQPLAPGERRKYVFDGIVEDITMLRVDPTDAGNATVDLHSIVIAGRNGILAQFGPQALATWATDALVGAGIDETALHLRTVTPQPIIMTSMAIGVSRSNWGWTRWLPMVNAPDASWRLAAMTLILLVAVASLDSARRLYLPLAAAAVTLVLLLLQLESRLPDGPASAAIAVSRATFLGSSTRPAMVTSMALMAGAALIGVTVGLIDRHRYRPVEFVGTRMKSWHAVSAVIVLGLWTSPDLHAWASSISTVQFIPHWDYDNYTYWAYLVHRGYLPLRDFWYPYGGLSAFELPFPTGVQLRWLYETVLFGILFAAIGKWRGTTAAVITTVLLFFAQRLAMLPGLERYLLAVNLFLTYLAARDTPGHSSRILFACCWAVALFIEPLQLLYAGGAIALVIASDGIEQWRTWPRLGPWIISRLRADFIVPAVLTVVFGLVLGLTGQLGEVLVFYGRLNDSVSYSAWPTGFPELGAAGFPRALLVIAWSAILITIGMYEQCRGGPRRLYGHALAGIGVVAIMMLQKHFVRWMDEHLFLLAVICPVIMAFGWPGRRRLAEYTVTGLILGAVAATLAAKPAAPLVLESMVQSPTRAATNLGVLTQGSRPWHSVNMARFSPDRFTVYASQRQVIERLRLHAGPGADLRVFAVTDDPVLYVMTGQPAVWVSNMYNTSPTYEQERMVRWLREDKPPYAVLDPDHLIWDGFHQAVRVPVVYSEVVHSYVPLDVVGRIHVARRRRSDEKPAIPYWRERLGADVDVGRLASVSSFRAGTTACSQVCGDLLEIEVPFGGTGRVTVSFVVADLPFSLTFTRVPSESTYRVLLDRVWFWNVAKRDGMPRSVAHALPAGVNVRVHSVPMKAGVLY